MTGHFEARSWDWREINAYLQHSHEAGMACAPTATSVSGANCNIAFPAPVAYYPPELYTDTYAHAQCPWTAYCADNEYQPKKYAEPYSTPCLGYVQERQGLLPHNVPAPCTVTGYCVAGAHPHALGGENPAQCYIVQAYPRDGSQYPFENTTPRHMTTCQKKVLQPITEDESKFYTIGDIFKQRRSELSETVEKVIAPKIGLSIPRPTIPTPVLWQWPKIGQVTLTGLSKGNFGIIEGNMPLPGNKGAKNKMLKDRYMYTEDSPDEKKLLKEIDYVSDYDVFMPCCTSPYYHPPPKRWCTEIIEFFSKMKPDDYINILTFGYRGDNMVNEHLLHNTENMACMSINPSDRKFKYTYKIHGGNAYNPPNVLKYCLFEPQARRILKLDDSCSVDDLEKILQQLGSDEWDPILEEYVKDLHALFLAMPALDEPMTVFRGESSWKDHPMYLTQNTNTKTIKSFTFDPCVACFFSRERIDEHSCNPDGKATGRILLITLLPGSRVLPTAGFNVVTDICEAEVRAMPGFQFTSEISDITSEITPKEGWRPVVSDGQQYEFVESDLVDLQFVHAEAITVIPDSDAVM